MRHARARVGVVGAEQWIEYGCPPKVAGAARGSEFTADGERLCGSSWCDQPIHTRARRVWAESSD